MGFLTHRPQVKQYLALLGIFIVLRLVMLDTGFGFFRIPYLDDYLGQILAWTKDLFKGMPRYGSRR